MKRRLLIGLLSLTIISTTAACSFQSAAVTNTNSEETTSETESETETASSNVVEASATATDSTDSEYSVLEIKTDWNEKATITFSDSGMTIDGDGATNENGVLYITEGGVYTLNGESSSCSIVINTEKNVKLILNGVTLSSTNGPVIYGAEVKNLYIELADGTTNTLSDSSTYATDSSTGDEIGKGVISCEDDIIILGNGTLNITANHKHGIVSDDKLYIESGNITITSAATDGLHANDLICIDGGTLTITASSDMMESEDMLVINGGTITGTSADEGIEAKGSLYINGGTIDIKVKDDGLNASTYIEINDGDITIVSTAGDAIDCNGHYDGCITINGGNINATGAGVPEGALDCDESSIIINGGTVVASGGTNSPVIQNGGDVDITGDTNTGMGGGPGGGRGFGGGFDGGEMPDDFDGEMPQMRGNGGGRGNFNKGDSTSSDQSL